MRMGKNKVLMIVLIVVAVLLIAGGVFAYLFLATDIFKSGQELFAKYLVQNLSQINETVNFTQMDEIENRIKESKYEETLTISYTEPEESETMGTITLDTQNDPINKKYYGTLGLLIDGFEEPLEVEYMKEENTYSLRFTNSVKQFLSVENSNLKQLAKNLGMDEADLEQIPDTINFEEFSFGQLAFTEEEKNAEIDKYSNLLYSNISKEKYTKTKNVIITVNGKTITANAYSLTLNTQDIKALVVKILETLKDDEIILAKLEILDEKLQNYTEESIKDSFVQTLQESIDNFYAEESSEDAAEDTAEEETITITIYEQNKNTVRVKMEQGLDNLTLDTIETEGKKQIDLNFTSINEDNTQVSNGVTYIKENDNKLTIEFNSIDGEEQQEAKINAEVVENDNNVKLNVIIESEYGNISFTRDITIVDEINYKVTLNSSNNYILNQLSAENLQIILNAVGAQVTTDYIKPLQTLLTPVDPEADLAEAEIAAFNGKFQVYEGEAVSTMQVNELLNTVLLTNMEEAGMETERYVTVSGDVTLGAEDTTVTKLEGDTYYNIQCMIDDNGLINEIVIVIAEQE